jgi:two-component system, sensor histidine kinase YesM
MILHSLTRKYVLIFLLFFFIPTVLVTIGTVRTIDGMYEQEMGRIFNSMVTEAAERIDELYADADRVSRFFVFSDMMQDYIKQDRSYQYDVDTIAVISDYLVYDITANSFIESIMIVKDGDELISEGAVYESVSGSEPKMDDSDNRIHWTSGYAARSYYGKEDMIVQIGRGIPNRKSMTSTIGNLILQVKVSTLYQIIDRNMYPGFSSLMITDEEGVIKISRDPQLIGSSIGEAALTALTDRTGDDEVVTEADGYLMQRSPLSFSDSYVFATIDRDSLFHEVNKIKPLFFLDILLLVLFGLVLLLFFYLSVVRRIERLSHDMHAITEKSLAVPSRPAASDEIGMLQRDFTSMIKRIQEHIAIEWELKVSQQEAVLHALHSQIDPHFLYNTLDMIRWTARLENANETEEMIEHLSSIFRMNVDSSRLWVSIEDEKKYVESYVLLLRRRLKDRVSLEFSCEEDVSSCMIPKQMIQPLVENCIKHGLDDSIEHLTIRVRIASDADRILIEVRDDGVGYQPEAGDEGPGVTCRNITERLQILFGPDHSLHMSTEGSWTVASLTLERIDDMSSQELSVTIPGRSSDGESVDR